jgi:hypothetical protein
MLSQFIRIQSRNTGAIAIGCSIDGLVLAGTSRQDFGHFDADLLAGDGSVFALAKKAVMPTEHRYRRYWHGTPTCLQRQQG